MRIITRGLGTRNMLVTRGYGRSIIERILREVIRLSTSFNQTIYQSTSFSFAVRLVTAINNKIKLTTRIGGMAERIWLATSFNNILRLSSVFRVGSIFLTNIFEIASRIVLSCGFDLRRRDE